MKYLFLILFSTHALACFSMKNNPQRTYLKNEELCKAANGKEYDYSFGQDLILKADGLSAHFKLVDARFKLLQISNGHLTGDFRDLNGAGVFTEGTFTSSDFRFADLRNFKFVNIKIEGGRFLGANLSGVDLSSVEFMDCDLTGAVFDMKTKLPFSIDEAYEKGMVIL